MSPEQTCTHLDTIAVTELPESVDGCDDSPGRHATAHATSDAHPLIRSLEPGEQWSWCFVDEVGMIIDGITGQTRIPPSPMLPG